MTFPKPQAVFYRDCNPFGLFRYNMTGLFGLSLYGQYVKKSFWINIAHGLGFGGRENSIIFPKINGRR